MIKKFLTDIMINPDSGSQLEYDPIKNTLQDRETAHSYDIIEDTPIVFSRVKNISVSSIHKKSYTSFDYREHYNKDVEFFDYFSEDDTAATRTERRRSREMIISKVPDAALKILDIGCGGAWVAEYFTKRKRYVISLDISLANPTKALKKYPGEFHAAVVADSLNLPFIDNSFDTIIASEVIEHLYDPKVFIEKWLSVLKPGGKLIMVTPYNEKIVYHTCIHCNNITPANAHLHSLNEKNLSDFLPVSGIKTSTTHFNNKYFTKLRIYSFFSFLPFRIWFFIDSIINKSINKPAVFIIEIIKN